MRRPRSLARRLRDHVSRHNRSVLSFALLSFLGSAVLWVALYLAVFALILLGLTVFKGEEATAPPHFALAFVSIAAGLIGAAWMERAIVVNERLPDRKPKFEIFMDFLLMIPRTTLAIWGNLSAWQSLSSDEYRLAAGLVERVARERRVPLQRVPIDIPDDRVREKIVFALLIVQVLEVRTDNGENWLQLSALRPTLDLPAPAPVVA